MCNDAAQASDFYVAVFAASETMRLAEPSGEIGHAELTIDGSTLMLAGEARAVAAGATVLRPLADQSHGDRSGTIEHPFGDVWIVATKREQLRAAEVERRYAKVSQGVMLAVASPTLL